MREPRKGIELIDRLESLFVDRGLSCQQIARRFSSFGLEADEIKALLIDAGLEVEGQVKAGYESSYRARANAPAEDMGNV